ncbi:leucine-rich repeat domain-containing protein [Planctomycetes bacterium K23_9]|uniref:Leucine Rich repeats (2 copies) n=1 Tax=Stieleria marina TaxID=1930275 RepID=A0A517NUN5_9BACT|nr:Leucine Rich repeats (2 copies) [Planctomycetes bacterium K23_9]
MLVVRVSFWLIMISALFASTANAATPVKVKIKSWNDADHAIELIYRGKVRTLPLAADASVTINGDEASLEQLPVDRHAAVIFDKATAAITSIAVTSIKDSPTAVAALKRSGAVIKQDALGNVVEVTSRMVKDRSQMTDAWLARVNWKGLPYVTVVNLNFTPVTDGGLSHLSDLKNLKELSLKMTQVTDSGIANLQSFPALESLSFGSHVANGLTGKSVRHASKTKRLVRLDVGMIALSNDDLAELANLTNLQELSLSACQLSNEGLSFLPKLKQLQFLDIARNGGKMANKSLDYISSLVLLERLRLSDILNINDGAMIQIKEFKDLDLNGTTITDAGFAHVKAMPQLKKLQVGGTRITDAGIVSIQSLSELQMLNISGTRTTKAGHDSLRSLQKLKTIVK